MLWSKYLIYCIMGVSLVLWMIFGLVNENILHVPCLLMWHISIVHLFMWECCNVCCSCGAIKSLSIPVSSLGSTCVLCVIVCPSCTGRSFFANCFHWHSSWVLSCFRGWTWGLWQDDDDDYKTACAGNDMTFFFLPAAYNYASVFARSGNFPVSFLM